MANRTVQNAQLTPNKGFCVRGVLTYARIASQIAGEELYRSDARRKAMGWLPIGRPYTTATVQKAQVLMQNPQAPTPEEVYAQESLYTSRNEAIEGYVFTANNKGKFLPWVGQRNPDGSVSQITPEGELDSGLNVTLCMRIFSVRGQINHGVTLDGIIVEEPIRYYTRNQTAAMLASMGIVFHANPDAENARQVLDQPAQQSVDEGFNQSQDTLPDTYGIPAQNVVQTQPRIPDVPPTNPQALPFSNPAIQSQGIRYTPEGVNTGDRNY